MLGAVSDQGLAGWRQARTGRHRSGSAHRAGSQGRGLDPGPALAAHALLGAARVRGRAGSQARLPRVHTAAARALQADLPWLLDQDWVHRQHDPDQSGAAAELRAAIDAWDDPDVHAPLHRLDVLTQRLAAGERLRHRGRYLATMLPHLYTHAADSTPAAERGERVAALLADAYSLMHAAANRYGLTDVVAQAVDRHVTIAESSGDPLRSLQRGEHAIAEATGSQPMQCGYSSRCANPSSPPGSVTATSQTSSSRTRVAGSAPAGCP